MLKWRFNLSHYRITGQSTHLLRLGAQGLLGVRWLTAEASLGSWLKAGLCLYAWICVCFGGSAADLSYQG